MLINVDATELGPGALMMNGSGSQNCQLHNRSTVEKNLSLGHPVSRVSSK